MARFTPHSLENERSRVRRRVEELAGRNPAVRARALTLLNGRLPYWYGENAPNLRRRFKNKVPDSAVTDVFEQEVEPAELLLVHAFAWTNGAAQFGVTNHGVVFTADGNGWTINDRMYLPGLSPVLDDAGDILSYLTAQRGGRFYERDGYFFTAAGHRTFMRVLTTSGKPHRSR